MPTRRIWLHNPEESDIFMGMELQDQVREARRAAKLSQEELARLAGVNRMDISRFEKGENVTMRKFLKIVNALPNLTELSLGTVQLKREGGDQPPAAEGGEDVRNRAAELLSRLPGAPSTPPDETAASRREQSLIRMFAELLLEIGSRDR